MTLTMTSPLTTEVGKLLLNAWSAEFALRIKPVSTNRGYLNSSLSWAFPQAYFAVLFSARAVLAVDGIQLANPEVIEKLLTKWANQGLYGSKITGDNNPFTDVMQYRIKGDTPTKRMSGPEAAALHVRLAETVHATAIIHESYLLTRMGADAYRLLIESLPQYLKDGFSGTRATFLLSDIADF